MKWNIGIGRNEFSRRLADNANITYKDSKEIVDAFIETLTQYLVEGQKVTFKGFGYFETVEKKPRRGISIVGEEMHVDAFKSAKFKQTRDMKIRLNEKENEQDE